VTVIRESFKDMDKIFLHMLFPLPLGLVLVGYVKLDKVK